MKPGLAWTRRSEIGLARWTDGCRPSYPGKVLSNSLFSNFLRVSAHAACVAPNDKSFFLDPFRALSQSTFLSGNLTYKLSNVCQWLPLPGTSAHVLTTMCPSSYRIEWNVRRDPPCATDGSHLQCVTLEIPNFKQTTSAYSVHHFQPHRALVVSLRMQIHSENPFLHQRCQQ
jgi:hypothetical protein